MAEHSVNSTQDSSTSEHPVDDVLPLLAKNLRRARTRKGYSLERLARASGVSRAMLGQIELSRSAPTINVLWRIATALDLPFQALLGEEGAPHTTLLRSRSAARLTSEDGGFVSRPLFPFGRGPRGTEFYELRLAPGCAEHADAHPEGTWENLVVGQGGVVLQVDKERHVLEAGDAILFRADVKHSYTNPGDIETTMYLVMTYALEGG